MRVDKVRIRHFQCVVDSGEIHLDEKLTVLVGANECGKSAIMKALWYFNQGTNFEQVDISTLASIGDRLGRKDIAPSDVDIATIWVTLSEEELIPLGVPTPSKGPQTFKIVKSFDNEYRSERVTQVPRDTSTKKERLLHLLEDLKARLSTVYKGRIKSSPPLHYYLFVESFVGENLKDNLILFPEFAPGLWDDLKAGDWIQVTRLAPDPTGRNTRALNAGVAVETEPLTNALNQLIESVSKNTASLDALGSLQRALNEIPKDHPLREVLSPEALQEVARLLRKEERAEQELSFGPDQLKSLLPDFVYLPSIPEVADSIAVRSLHEEAIPIPESLVASLAKAAGLQPQAVSQENEIVRKKSLNDKSKVLTERLREHWVNPDLTVEFDKQGQKLTVWVESGRSYDPPSRRSKGLSSYLSVFAKFAELSTHRNIVVLLDDPGINLHPVAQRKMLPLLDSQPFQIIVATHLPFMIDPDHLERIRVVTRREAGTSVEDDWSTAGEDLLPVWGSLLANYSTNSWLVVEGISDKKAYASLSHACAGSGKASLPAGLSIVPGGGNQLKYLVPELFARGVRPIVLLDGDKEGREIKKEILRIHQFPAKRVMTLDEMSYGMKDPVLQDLFETTDEFVSSQDPKLIGKRKYATKTIQRFSEIFSRLTAVISVT